MKKNSKASEAYAELSRLGREPMTPEIVAKLRKTIGGKTSLLVSKAVEIAAQNGLVELVPEMLEAFGRFAEDGAEVDKGCRAKTSIVNALNRFEYLGGAIYLAGAYYVQMEPAFGLPEDTAVEIRSSCALALARIVHPEAHFVLTDLLVDNERSVRAAAAKALTYLGDPEGEALLRLKVLTGDKEPEVIAECFVGLMTMAPTRSLDFVSRYLVEVGGRFDTQQTLMESAALAIGGSHLPEALDKLITAYNRRSSTARRALLLPIALIRSDAAFEHLLNVVRTADPRLAADAIVPLHLYTGDKYVDRVREVVSKRADREISLRFAEEYAE